ncbi:MAG: DUF6679 family protein [Cyanobacteria bacterium P01_A01_bin.84]
MLHRKIYQLCCDGREVCVFLRDQQRWIERARIIDIEGDLVTLRYETEEEDEVCSWEEMIRLESIGAINQKLASVPRGNFEPLLTEECPEEEKIRDRYTDSNPEQ